jgi:phosphonoacetate hydrolase
MSSQITVNERQYAVPPVCAIAICLDGCEPAYLDAAIEAGLMPTLARMRKEFHKPE